MLKTEKTVIDGLKVSTQQFQAIASATLQTRLAKHLGPAFVPILVAGAERGSLQGLDVGTLAEAFTRADPDAVMALVRQILSKTSVTRDDKVIDLYDDMNIDLAFEGKPKALWQVVWFALKVNFADFFPRSPLATNDVPAAEKAQAKTST